MINIMTVTLYGDKVTKLIRSKKIDLVKIFIRVIYEDLIS